MVRILLAPLSPIATWASVRPFECITWALNSAASKAVDDFNLTIGKTEIAGPHRFERVQVRPRSSTCSPKCISPRTAPSCSTVRTPRGKSVYQGQPHGHCPYVPEHSLFNTMTVEDKVKVGLHNLRALIHALRACCAAGRIEARGRPPTSAMEPCCPFLTWSTWQNEQADSCPTAPSVVWKSSAHLPPTRVAAVPMSLPPA